VQIGEEYFPRDALTVSIFWHMALRATRDKMCGVRYAVGVVMYGTLVFKKIWMSGGRMIAMSSLHETVMRNMHARRRVLRRTRLWLQQSKALAQRLHDAKARVFSYNGYSVVAR
jgi:hypothetical protein